MKKALLVGCGVVLLILVSLGGFVGWVFWGPVTQLIESFEATAPRFTALDESYPFDGTAVESLDDARFVASLELRAELNQLMQRMGDEVAAMQADEELPVWQRLRAPFVLPTAMLPEVADAFEQHQMGPTEFRYDSRLLWAALRELDKGGGPPALSDLRDRFSHLRSSYEQAAEKIEDAKSLDEIIGHVSSWPPAVLDAALMTMVAHSELVHQALLPIELEPLAMQFDSSDPEAMGALVMPFADGQSSVTVGR